MNIASHIRANCPIQYVYKPGYFPDDEVGEVNMLFVVGDFSTTLNLDLPHFCGSMTADDRDYFLDLFSEDFAEFCFSEDERFSALWERFCSDENAAFRFIVDTVCSDFALWQSGGHRSIAEKRFVGEM